MFFEKITKIKKAKKIIYVTEFDANSWPQFPMGSGERLSAGPTAHMLANYLILQIVQSYFSSEWQDILRTGSKIKHHIICMSSSYHTK